MPFLPPTLNLVCNIWTGPTLPATGPPRLSPGCQLRNPGKLHTGEAYLLEPTSGANVAVVFAELLVAKHTDVRDTFSNPLGGDIVEVPASSGRFYAVTQVEDVGKGFTNEYRIAYLIKVAPWPTPIP